MPDTTPTDRSSLLSPNGTGPSPTWAPPRAPLPPHRLAKLANALGVSTPVPVSHSYSLPPFSPPSQPNTAASSSFPDSYRRSPTPSVSSGVTHTPTSSTSKYLLHVIPPEHLPHDFADESDLTPLPASASGYHTQFRRGVMVPVFSTLQAQLSAIAREYALPSTVGMVLYLITTSASPGSEITDEPGPRISEEIWKHIWTRVLRAEREESFTPGPKPLGLGFSVAGRSSPALLQDIAQSNSLRAIISPKRFDTPQPQPPSNATPSPSTPSNSAYSSQSEVDTPESASSVDVSGDGAGNSLPLPGLSSPSLIPILAKVEFDIDKRKAGWYENWVRSRKANLAKRAESRLGSRSRMGTVSSMAEEEGDEPGTSKKAPIDLELVNRVQAESSVPKFLLTAEKPAQDSDSDDEEGDKEGLDAGYQQLSESPVDLGASDPDGEELEVEGHLNGNEDPLADVFGTDQETWVDIHAESASKRHSNPNIVDLPLDGAALSNPHADDMSEDELGGKDDGPGEITQLLNSINRPSLSVDIPSSPPREDFDATATAATVRRHIPPPLNLVAAVPGELGVPASSSPHPDSATSVQLAYLKDGMSPAVPSPSGSSTFDETEDMQKERSPLEERREGAIFDELNLGLDPSITEDGSEFDENDPYDRRKSQYIMAAQLDEIEKTLAQFSPRALKTEILEDESPLRSASLRSARSPRSLRSPPQSISSSGDGAVASWPAVPFSALSTTDRNSRPDLHQVIDDDASRPPSPPRFAINGISTEPPKSPFLPNRPKSGMSDESMARKRELEEENALYPPLNAPNMFAQSRPDSESPIIPLSPDPFGRFPSQAESIYLEDQRDSQLFQDATSSMAPTPEPVIYPPDRTSSLVSGPREDRPTSHAPSSRFSFDSVTSEEAGKASQKTEKGSSSLMGMKSIRRLWRKSGKQQSISSTPTIPESGRTSPNVPPTQAPVANGRARSKSVSRAPPPIADNGLPVPSVDPRLQNSYRPVLDGDSRYPVHPSPRQASPPLPAIPSPNARPPSIGVAESANRS
ncbi:hypothetical protein K474DRAFT_1695308 [Panus rudis PR-1116 ss-1]|nr:hypothetical protein K474DRAFT_1695308 [Panus rudis PR-1116 ss-1]